jgi:hypothetical protein
MLASEARALRMLVMVGGLWGAGGQTPASEI